MNLYDIEQSILDVLDMRAEAIDSGDEDTVEACNNTLDSLDMDLREKGENIIKYAKNCAAQAKILREEGNRLVSAARRQEKAAESAKNYLKGYMESTDMKKHNFGMFTATVASNGVAPIITNVPASELPDRYRFVEYKPNTIAIKQAIAEKRDLELFGYGEKGTHLIITTGGTAHEKSSETAD